jgi:3',5'-cyclic AMP phosphodiesterase CpdA
VSLVLQVSDTHFGTERAPVVEALVELARRERPDLVVLSGDITQRARPAQFRAARVFAHRLRAPLLAIPGNHDIPLWNPLARLLRPYAGQRAAFGESLEPVFMSDTLFAIGVNTTRPSRHEKGVVGAEQIERVAHLLETAATGQLRIVVVHQPAAVIRAEDVRDRLVGHAAALARWAQAGADVVMGGHIHLPYVTQVEGMVRPLWVVQAGTAVSARVREGVPNSVNLLRWDGALASVEQWDCPADGPAFERRVVTEMKPARPGDGHR